jgi:hypothetical protein
MSVLSSAGARYLPAAIYPKIREYGIVAPAGVDQAQVRAGAGRVIVRYQ